MNSVVFKSGAYSFPSNIWKEKEIRTKGGKVGKGGAAR